MTSSSSTESLWVAVAFGPVLEPRASCAVCCRASDWRCVGAELEPFKPDGAGAAPYDSTSMSLPESVSKFRTCSLARWAMSSRLGSICEMSTQSPWVGLGRGLRCWVPFWPWEAWARLRGRDGGSSTGVTVGGGDGDGVVFTTTAVKPGECKMASSSA